MFKKLATIGAAAAIFAASALPALAHPGDPDYNFAQWRGQGIDCTTTRWFVSEPVHDGAGNTYGSQAEACFSGGAVFWSGPAH